MECSGAFSLMALLPPLGERKLRERVDVLAAPRSEDPGADAEEHRGEEDEREERKLRQRHRLVELLVHQRVPSWLPTAEAVGGPPGCCTGTSCGPRPRRCR